MAIMARSCARKAQVAARPDARTDARAARAARRAAARVAAGALAARLAAEPEMLALREKRKRLGEGAAEATETTANDTTGPDHHGDEDLSINHDDDDSRDDDDSHGDMKQKAEVYPNLSNPTAHGRRITQRRQEKATALMVGVRKNGVEWLMESLKKMIRDCYDRSESRNTYAQPKDGEEEEGEQMATVLKSASTAAAKLDFRRGDMWSMLANEIAKDLPSQLDRLIGSIDANPELGDIEKSALVADAEKFRKASQANRYKTKYLPTKEIRSEYPGPTIVQHYQCQIAETEWASSSTRLLFSDVSTPPLRKS